MARLEWEACYNVRDLGGYPTKEGERTRQRAIIRADDLYRLTPVGRQALVAYGVRTIIDLRFAEELAAMPNPFADGAEGHNGLRYLNIPLQGDGSEAVEAQFRAADSILARYRLALDLTGPAFAKVMSAIAEAPEGPVLYHCHAGRDRTGLVAALLLRLAGVPDEAIVEDYQQSDEYIRPLNEEFLRSMSDAREREKFVYELTIARQTMRGFLSYLDARHGGAEAYLRAQGVSPENLGSIKRRLVDKG